MPKIKKKMESFYVYFFSLPRLPSAGKQALHTFEENIEGV